MFSHVVVNVATFSQAQKGRARLSVFPFLIPHRPSPKSSKLHRERSPLVSTFLPTLPSNTTHNKALVSPAFTCRLYPAGSVRHSPKPPMTRPRSTHSHQPPLTRSLGTLIGKDSHYITNPPTHPPSRRSPAPSRTQNRPRPGSQSPTKSRRAMSHSRR